MSRTRHHGKRPVHEMWGRRWCKSQHGWPNTCGNKQLSHQLERAAEKRLLLRKAYEAATADRSL